MKISQYQHTIYTQISANAHLMVIELKDFWNLPPCHTVSSFASITIPHVTFWHVPHLVKFVAYLPTLIFAYPPLAAKTATNGASKFRPSENPRQNHQAET